MYINLLKDGEVVDKCGTFSSDTSCQNGADRKFMPQSHCFYLDLITVL